MGEFDRRIHHHRRRVCLPMASAALTCLLGAILGSIVLIAVGGIGYLNFAFPQVDAAEDINIELTAERTARRFAIATGSW